MQKNNKNSHYCSVVTVVSYKRCSLEERCEIKLRSYVSVSVRNINRPGKLLTSVFRSKTKATALLLFRQFYANLLFSSSLVKCNMQADEEMANGKNTKTHRKGASTFDSNRNLWYTIAL